MWLAVLAIYFIDFPINAGTASSCLTPQPTLTPPRAVQAVDRALLVDTLPTDEQAQGNAWAAQMLGIGSVVGFFVYVPRALPAPRRRRSPHTAGTSTCPRSCRGWATRS